MQNNFLKKNLKKVFPKSQMQANFFYTSRERKTSLSFEWRENLGKSTNEY